MMPLNHKLKMCTGAWKLSKSQEKINRQMYMDIIKLFDKNEKQQEALMQTVRTYIQDMEMIFGIQKCARLIMKSGKRHMNGTTKSRKN